MAFNYPYPATYQNPYSAPMQYPMHNNPITQPTNSDFIWVQGEAGAKAYPVAPNTSVHLWDSEKQIIYIKSANATGVPSMQIIDYTIRKSNQQHTPLDAEIVDTSEFITRAEFDELKSTIESMQTMKPSRKESAKNESTVSKSTAKHNAE